MPDESALQKHARSLEREIARLDQAIAQMSAYNQEDQREQLERLRTVRALRERELNDTKGQLAAKG
jgi:hypothetical protein